jgi:hypothetical protein
VAATAAVITPNFSLAADGNEETIKINDLQITLSRGGHKIEIPLRLSEEGNLKRIAPTIDISIPKDNMPAAIKSISYLIQDSLSEAISRGGSSPILTDRGAEYSIMISVSNQPPHNGALIKVQDFGALNALSSDTGINVIRGLVVQMLDKAQGNPAYACIEEKQVSFAPTPQGCP